MNTTIGGSLKTDDLLQDGYDAIFVGTGDKYGFFSDKADHAASHRDSRRDLYSFSRLLKMAAIQLLAETQPRILS